MLKQQRAFTLVELMIGITITALLLTVAVPSMRDFIRKASVKSAAEALLNSIRTAQANAIRTNTSTELALTESAATSGNVTAGTSTSGPNWMVRRSDQSAYISGFNLSEVGNSITVKASAGAIRFTGMAGARAADNTALASNFWTLLADSSVSYARCVYVTPGGTARMCDPAAASGTPSSCGPTINTATECK